MRTPLKKKRKRFKLDVSVFVLLIRDGKILFIQRQPETGFQGTWSLPAGGLDPNETVFQAAARETWEEVRIRVKVSDLKHVHTIHCLTNGNNWIGMFFTTTEWEGEPLIAEPDKHQALDWRNLNDLPAELRLYVRQAIMAIQENKTMTTFGWSG